MAFSTLAKLKSSPVLQAVLFSVCLVFAVFFWHRYQGPSPLWDEGFLWYGAQRVLAGEVPIRDFRSYDPGRYYWVAAFMSLLGDSGIMALRWACVVFQALGVCLIAALLARSSQKPERSLWPLATVMLMLWIYPLYRAFDDSIVFVLMGALAFLIQRPSTQRYFLAGLCVGFAAVFGRNHGIYGIVASLMCMCYLAFGQETLSGFAKNIVIWALGIIAGYLPVLLMIAFVPGFAHAFAQDIAFLLEARHTNLPLPVPWAWEPSGQPTAIGAVRYALIGCFFIIIVAYGILGIGWAVWQKVHGRILPPLFVASAFLALPYAHFAYSRADVEHLSFGIFPFLIGFLLLLKNSPGKIRWPCAALLFAASLLITVPTYRGVWCYATGQCVPAEVGGSILEVWPWEAEELATLRTLNSRFAPGDRSFIALPYWPGAYALLGKKAPLWDMYPFYPRDENFEREEVERIKAANPGFTIIYDYPLDGHDALRFRNTRPIIDQYIRDNFVPLTGYMNDPSYQIYKSRQ